MKSRSIKIAVVLTACLSLWQFKFNRQSFTKTPKPEGFPRKSVRKLVKGLFDVEAPTEVSHLQCYPTHQFVYIKTHKTGSTTLYALLNKYIQKHGIARADKLITPFLGGYPGPLDVQFVYTRRENRYQKISVPSELSKLTISEHFRYSESLRDVMPSDIPYFTIIRDPWHHFQSAYYYYYGQSTVNSVMGETCFRYPFYHVAEGQKTSGPVEYLLKAEKNLNSSVPWFFRSSNYQSFDLGIDPQLNDDLEIENAVRSLSWQLDLVLITDYYDHSLILLKQLLCLDWEDLMYENDGSNHKYTSIDIRNHPKAYGVFQGLYKQDIALYNHFNDTLWRKVKEYGHKRMENDLKILQSKREQYRLTANKGKHVTRTKRAVSIPQINQQDIFRLAQSRSRNKKEMVTLLIKKLLRYGQMDLGTATNMAIYMAAHGGSCPL